MQKTHIDRPRWIAESGVIAAVFVSVVVGTGITICLFALIIKIAHVI